MSCEKTKLSPNDYVNWVEDNDNGLNVSKDFKGISFHVLYKPVNYIVAKEFLNGGVKKNETGKRITELGNMQYVTLRINVSNSNEVLGANLKSQNEYYERLEYYMNNIQDDLMLIEDKDTLPCLLSHFERNYGLAPYNDIVLAFGESINKSADKLIVFNDRVFGTGPVMLKINNKNLKNAPSVSWN
ncbi:MAG: hypothetical protein C0448_14475 [Sphingobacteriaceae bacterium]|nr:hypothetical protein [Sphingobacteriaceae bacterium]